eukprot:gene10116-biopygen19779
MSMGGFVQGMPNDVMGTCRHPANEHSSNDDMRKCTWESAVSDVAAPPGREWSGEVLQKPDK